MSEKETKVLSCNQCESNCKVILTHKIGQKIRIEPSFIKCYQNVLSNISPKWEEEKNE